MKLTKRTYKGSLLPDIRPGTVVRVISTGKSRGSGTTDMHMVRKQQLVGTFGTVNGLGSWEGLINIRFPEEFSGWYFHPEDLELA